MEKMIENEIDICFITLDKITITTLIIRKIISKMTDTLLSLYSPYVK